MLEEKKTAAPSLATGKKSAMAFALAKGDVRPDDTTFAPFFYAGAKQLRRWADDDLITETEYDAAIADFKAITLG